MCPCPRLDNRLFLSLGIIVLTLCSLSAFSIMEYANNLQLAVIGNQDVPSFYNVIMGINKIYAIFVPIIICLFIYSTTYLMLSEVFEEEIRSKELFTIVCIAMIPVLMYDYFYWFNLIYYVHIDDMHSINDFFNVTYWNGLKLSDFHILNTVCWLLLFTIVIIFLIWKGHSIIKSLLSVLIPPSIVILIYLIIH